MHAAARHYFCSCINDETFYKHTRIHNVQYAKYIIIYAFLINCIYNLCLGPMKKERASNRFFYFNLGKLSHFELFETKK